MEPGVQKEPYTFCVKDNGVFGVMGQDPLLGVTVESQHEQEASPKPSGRLACQPETPSHARRTEALWGGTLICCYSNTTHFVFTAGMFPFQKCVAFSNLRVNGIVRVGHVIFVPSCSPPRASVYPSSESILLLRACVPATASSGKRGVGCFCCLFLIS